MDDVLDVIKNRYTNKRAIYTWCGIALVAVNPYQEIEIYNEQAVETYHSPNYLHLEPHIYAVFEDAYLKLDTCNQSIIVSGESGAGKTVSAKLSMNYFASIASSRNCKLKVEKRLVASNPIMEAIGNATTARNDNSSRFGKYIQIYFDKNSKKISGGNVRTYLLEKSRVTKQQANERNFHIFYQLLEHERKLKKQRSNSSSSSSSGGSGSSSNTNEDLIGVVSNSKKFNKCYMDYVDLKLATSIDENNGDARPFKYLGGIEPTASMDDFGKFEASFATLGINEKYCDIVKRIIAGILHGGNIEFEQNKDNDGNNGSSNNDSCFVNENEFHFKACCELLGFNVNEAANKLTSRRLRVCNDVIITPVSVCNAEYGRDAMFKALYNSLFAFLVKLINESLGNNNTTTTTTINNNNNNNISNQQQTQPTNSCNESPNISVLKSPSVLRHTNNLVSNSNNSSTPITSANNEHDLNLTSSTFIGVLDIFGFENFDTNSFEQFLINYANEVLQQQFNQHVFKIEQEEYIRENIDWTFIEFTDNQPVIDLIESKPIGIINLLIEECRMPKGSDETWCAKLHEQLPKSFPKTAGNIFKKPKLNYKTQFTICHYAEEVTYTVESFLEKNRDALWEQQSELLMNSEFLRIVYAPQSSPLLQQCNVNNSTTITTSNSLSSSNSPSLLSSGISSNSNTTMNKASSNTLAFNTNVAAQFKASLNSLMKTLNSTEPHYIRCIKPNYEKRAFEFDDQRVVDQLRACGVYETIRMSANGFPSRWSYKEFARRYYFLIVGTEQFKRLFVGNTSNSCFDENNQQQLDKQTNSGQANCWFNQLSSSNARPVCEAICEVVYSCNAYDHLLLEAEAAYINELKALKLATSPIYQFGKTKIFFRSHQANFLERSRNYKLRNFAITIQRHIRGLLARKYCQKLRLEIEEQRAREEEEERLWNELQEKLKQEEEEQEERERQLAEKLKQQQQHEEDCIKQQALSSINASNSKYDDDDDDDDDDDSYSNMGDETLTCLPESAHQESSLQSNELVSVVENMYEAMVRLMYSKIQNLIVDAVLEFDGLDYGGPFASIDTTASTASLKRLSSIENSMECLINELDAIQDLIIQSNIHNEIALLIYKQLFYLICAQCLNQLLLRQDLCHWEKAIRIQYNLSSLTQWVREKQLYKWQEIVEQLDPITQSTKLLQTRKTSENIPTIVEMCNKLRPSQIVKIVNMYTSSYEEQISKDFVYELETHLYETIGEANNNLPPVNNNLLMDTRKMFTLKVG